MPGMDRVLLLPIEFFYFFPFILGPITGAVCGMVMRNLRLWHGLLLGFVFGPVMAIPTFIIALVSWASTGSDEMNAGAQQAHTLLMLLVIPAACGLCFLVSRMRKELGD